MDITNYQNQLFNVINRSYLLDGVSGKPIEDGVTIKNYTDLIQNRSYANYPYERTNQLDGLTHIGTFGKGNSQRSKLPEPIIKCTPRKNETASRFNYARDKYIDKRKIDMTGQYIPNHMLRVIPHRGTQLYSQNRNLPRNDAILDLSLRIGDISAASLDKTFKLSNSDLNFKASRERLSRDAIKGLKTTPPVSNNAQSVSNTLASMNNTPLSSIRSGSSVGSANRNQPFVYAYSQGSARSGQYV
jgi:hypothetical protein